MTNDPVTLIKEDHKVVEALFAEFEGLSEGSVATKRKIVDQIIFELNRHADMEETICYPRFKEVFGKTDDAMVDEAYVEHDSLKKLLDELESMDASTPEYDATVAVLMEQVRHHVEEEEGELLPRVKEEMSKDELAEMGELMISFKDTSEVLV